MATEHFRRANTNSGDRYKYTWCCWLKQANRTQDNNSYIFSQGSMGESQMLDSALFFDGNTYTNRSLRYHWNGNSASIRVDPDFSGTEKHYVDNVHYTNEGYKEVAKLWAEKILSLQKIN